MKSVIISLLLLILVFSADSQTIYTWNGSVNTQFSTAGNWSPFRQYMYATDILIVENSGYINITNVNQITVGQLFIRNNTHVTMSPNSGNPRVLSIQGLTGDDFVIETGSSLTITGNDPKLSIYIKTGAIASISGNLTFNGSQAHNINSQDSLAVIFKNGSVLYQKTPGYVFTNSGVQNSIIFENGSTFVVENSGALSPFGLNTPDSKVRFEKGSCFLINASPSASLKFNGRTISNLKINNGISLTICDTLTNGITIDSIYLAPFSSLNIINTISSTNADINIKGNLNIEGNFSVGSQMDNTYKLNFSGSEMQSILGKGYINFPLTSIMEINNDVQLLRDLSVNSSVNSTSGNIRLNGYMFIVRGKILNILWGENDNRNRSENENINTPGNYAISQNYPNPFNSQTKIEFNIPSGSNVSIKLYDVTGKLVSEILNQHLPSGSYKINYDSKDISSGIYFYSINAGSFSKTLKMIVVK